MHSRASPRYFFLLLTTAIIPRGAHRQRYTEQAGNVLFRVDHAGARSSLSHTQGRRGAAIDDTPSAATSAEASGSGSKATVKPVGSAGKGTASIHQDELLRPVAIDLGAYSVRISLPNGSGKPPVTLCCPNAIVRQAQRRSGGAATNAALIGPHIKLQCTNFGALSIRQPMDRGVVVDWAAQKAVLDAALTEALSREKTARKTKPSRLLEGRAVIITEAYLNLPDLQSALDLLIMEEYGAASLWRCAPALLIPYTPNLFARDAATTTSSERTRPECMLVVDLGHGASHAVPVVGDAIVWKGVRRHVISQRLLTNLLKESISFRQWDMMDEDWLVGHIKEQCCFVAASAGRRGDTTHAARTQRPSEWSFAALVEMCEATAKGNNAIAQEYVLPDYSGPSAEARYGFIRRGPGSSSLAGGESDNEDAFIAADWTSMQARETSKQKGDASSEDEGDDSDDDFDELIDGSGDDAEGGGPRKKQRKSSGKAAQAAPKKASASVRRAAQDDEAEQVLILERERFQVPEVMFNPGVIGVDEAPLQDVIAASIEACDADVRDMLWANIVLVGGGARMRGLRRRIVNELRPLAPVDVPLHVWSASDAEDPAMSAIRGAEAIISSAAGTPLDRLLRAHLLPASEYGVAGSRGRFGSWSSQ